MCSLGLDMDAVSRMSSDPADGISFAYGCAAGRRGDYITFHGGAELEGAAFILCAVPGWYIDDTT